MDKLDILQRDEFVKQLERMIENISANKSSTCFAINGKWGSGKTFVLDMLQEQLEEKQSEKTAADKYFIIHYNSWKYDYYEEPVIALVVSIVRVIENKIKLMPDSKTKSKGIGILKAAGEALLSVTNDVLKNKIGIDIQKGYEIFKKGNEEGKLEYERKHAYDIYFNLNKVMEELASALENISKEYTIIFLVDELDRCMPEYAIKVLERLHHLTEGKSNIITVISMDKDQLKKSVEKIFGIDNPDKYLEKFIHFEVKLDYGEISETIMDKYPDYIVMFDKDILPFNEPVEECLRAIFRGVDIRTQEQLVKRATIAHKLLYKGKKDYSFMCMELLLAVMICVYNDNSCFSKTPITIIPFDKIFTPLPSTNSPAFTDFFVDKFNKINFTRTMFFESGIKYYSLPSAANLYAAIIYSWVNMHELNKDGGVAISNSLFYNPIAKNPEELKKFAEMIKMMS
ncbi:MAG TPA: KAP family NTPase [Candidatus Fusicatenibacter intestinipullorum]|nr:KAP family NTPase [Candidatus Fusicatenibacter intestinipullorum]